MAGRLRLVDARSCPATECGAWVYFIREGHDGPIKIGYAWRITDRLTSAQVGNYRRLYLIGAIYVVEAEPIRRGRVCRRTRELEVTLHDRFASARIRGEWFMPTESLLEYVAALPPAVLADTKAVR